MRLSFLELDSLSSLFINFLSFFFYFCFKSFDLLATLCSEELVHTLECLDQYLSLFKCSISDIIFIVFHPNDSLLQVRAHILNEFWNKREYSNLFPLLFQPSQSSIIEKNISQQYFGCHIHTQTNRIRDQGSAGRAVSG